MSVKATNKRTSGARELSAKQALSVRFTVDERSIVDQATQKTGQSTARFLQEAALARAYDILNADAGKERLLALARTWAERIADPSAVVTKTVAGRDHETVVYHASEGKLELAFEEQEVDSIVMNRPSPHELDELALALETAATEFAALMREALVSYGPERDQYQPLHKRSKENTNAKD